MVLCDDVASMCGFLLLKKIFVHVETDKEKDRRGLMSECE